MKKPIIIANWKMKLNFKEAKKLAGQIKKGLPLLKKCQVVICPSFTALPQVGGLLKLSRIKLGAQNVFWEMSGAYTGEISPGMLKELGCKYVIIGHSERRQYQRETDFDVHKKVKAVLSAGLIPIVCVGEKFEERQQGDTDYILIKQITGALQGIDIKNKDKVIVAYEPVWVIGTGQAVEPEEASHAHNVIKQTLVDIFSENLAEENFKIIYGGSIDSKNIKSFMEMDNIEGVLVGGASLKANEFIKIIKLAK